MKRRVTRPGRRGRPKKFGRAAEHVQLTLPSDVVRGLSRIDGDLARAIVQLYERAPDWALEPTLDFELVTVANRHSLIVVNVALIRRLPGIDIIPLDGMRAFLALSPGRTVSDLELAVIDRLSEPAHLVPIRERQALKQMRLQLRAWREDPVLRFHGRTIIIVEAKDGHLPKPAARPAQDLPPHVELLPFARQRYLIVVDAAFSGLSGIDVIPMARSRGFLALAPGGAAGDLERALVGRLAQVLEKDEKEMLERLRGQLAVWRRDQALTFHAREIIVVESQEDAREEPVGRSLSQPEGSGTEEKEDRLRGRSWPIPARSTGVMAGGRDAGGSDGPVPRS